MVAVWQGSSEKSSHVNMGLGSRALPFVALRVITEVSQPVVAHSSTAIRRLLQVQCQSLL